eukprot:699129-Pyramimonas_sp.AAC.1
MGRRGVHFALGHCAGMFERVRAATSQSFQEMLLEVDSTTAGRMMQIKTSITERWCSVVGDKLSFWNHVPHKIVGAFAEHFGFDADMGRRHCGGPPTSLHLSRSVFGMRLNGVCAFWPQVVVPGGRLLRCSVSAVGRRGGIAFS